MGDAHTNEHRSYNGNSQYKVVLGTSSKYRHRLFRGHFPGIATGSAAADIDEHAVTADGEAPRHLNDPAKLVLAIANAKADALLNQGQTQSSPNRLVDERNVVLLTSDQVITCDGEIREKPTDETQCRQFLKSYGTGTHAMRSYTSIVLTIIDDRRVTKRVQDVDVAEQEFDPPIEQSVIDKLVAKKDVLYCSGGITIEDPLLEPFLKDPRAAVDSVMGLPTQLVKRLFEQAGINMDEQLIKFEID